ncbi:hypothetical protein CANCADRAFT_2323 [Tortispora caseinolytica NRRL Y-17796]|uniref:PRP1 splicing factor N-terminal domain-containing protein n=1 Tax=Tortispora caseinolytica NRRL Y-17796 TaxID=767744 RepID=A0A1E4TFW3_9ASCO|nr:hypothetical protein CANCADRAFT_2323 [Tortispora caseinolytica NRRL Y-17796]
MDFLNQSPPPGYIPGIGRGATGFSTRSDIGTAQPVADQLPGPEGARDDPDSTDTGLLGTNQYTKEDEEADDIYKQIDRRMETRRKHRNKRQAVSKPETLADQFADLKRNLASISDYDWSALPEASDNTGKNKRHRQLLAQTQRFYAVPDSVVAGSIVDTTRTAGSIDMHNLTEARGKILKDSLDNATAEINSDVRPETVGGIEDSDLSDTLLQYSASNVGDTDKTRKLIESVLKSNPAHAPAWIALAQLECSVAHTSKAKRILADARANCPSSEDIWLESLKIASKKDALSLAREAVLSLPKSIALWKALVDAETDNTSKLQSLQSALQQNPTSAELWEAYADHQDSEENTKLVLRKSVELVPESAHLWLRLASLETYEVAKSVLKQARDHIAASLDLWIAEIVLDESQQQSQDILNGTSFSALQNLSQQGVMPSRKVLFAEANKCIEDDHKGAALALIDGLQKHDSTTKQSPLTDLWLNDYNYLTNKGYKELARLVLVAGLTREESDIDLWHELYSFDQENSGDVIHTLESAIAYCPDESMFPLMLAKTHWANGYPDKALEVLKQSLGSLPDDEDLWLAYAKVQTDTGALKAAAETLKTARTSLSTERIWVRSVYVARLDNDLEKALALVQDGLAQYPNSSKLWLQKAQIEESSGDSSSATKTYMEGTRRCPKVAALWISYAKFEKSVGTVGRMRAILDNGLVHNRDSEQLWYARIQVEIAAGNKENARNVASRAVQASPKSGLLLSESIALEPRTQQKSRLVDALRRLDNDPNLLCAVGKTFFREKNWSKAQLWIERAVKAEPDNGDAWGWLNLTMKHSPEVTEKERTSLIERFIKADPRHGIIWPAIFKDLKHHKTPKVELLQVLSNTLEESNRNNI